MLSFEQSHPQRYSRALCHTNNTLSDNIPTHYCRHDTPTLPEMSEGETVRHFTKLSQLNYSIDTHFYPLGSCTMKYNPRAANQFASLPGFLNQHPLANLANTQGFMACLHDLQTMLCSITGMRSISLSPMAGAQGEFAGVAMIKAYHAKRRDTARTEMIVPDAAHGTNPASAATCGYTVRELPTAANGDIDLAALEDMLGPHTAGIMLTNPSTLGVFDRNILTISDMVHKAGGLLYYDGANLNAIMGQARPGDMGFDVMHLNLHKTFATPHGGGGPGSGPVAAADSLKDFLPIPMVTKDVDQYRWLTKTNCPDSIGQLSTFMGNAGVLLRAFIYARMLGCNGIQRVGEFATLNANYLMVKLKEAGFTLAYPERRATHEFIITLKPLTKATGVTAQDFVKRLLDYGIHAPTVYFPLLVPECLLIEPTETESMQTCDHFVDVMKKILDESHTTPETVKTAPHTCPVGRLDEVKAAKSLRLKWHPTTTP